MIQGCDATKAAARGLCMMHYHRSRRGTDLSAPRQAPPPPKDPRTPEERITKQADGCWLWTGSVDRDGYGYLFLDGKYRFAHRWAYAEANGAVPEGCDVDHLCYVRACVNPAHLEAVSRSENSLRMWARARQE